MIPAEAFKFDVPMDPAECLDYQFRLRDNPVLLEATETFTSYTLTLYPEAIALGVEIGSGAYAPVTDGVILTIWFQVDPAFATDPAFDGDGLDAAMELSIVTSNAPPRKRQRTVILPVRQL